MTDTPLTTPPNSRSTDPSVSICSVFMAIAFISRGGGDFHPELLCTHPIFYHLGPYQMRHLISPKRH